MAVETSFDPFHFRHRHLGPSSDDVQRMLQVVGAPTLDALIDEAIPGDIRQGGRWILVLRCPSRSYWRRCAKWHRATGR